MDYKETYEKILGEYRQVFERVDQDNMRAFIDEVKAHDRIFLIGVGREGMATRAFSMRLMHMGIYRRGRFTDCDSWRWTYRAY